MSRTFLLLVGPRAWNLLELTAWSLVWMFSSSAYGHEIFHLPISKLGLKVCRKFKEWGWMWSWVLLILHFACEFNVFSVPLIFNPCEIMIMTSDISADQLIAISTCILEPPQTTSRSNPWLSSSLKPCRTLRMYKPPVRGLGGKNAAFPLLATTPIDPTQPKKKRRFSNKLLSCCIMHKWAAKNLIAPTWEMAGIGK